jgi:hypothetical protein
LGVLGFHVATIDVERNVLVSHRKHYWTSFEDPGG